MENLLKSEGDETTQFRQASNDRKLSLRRFIDGIPGIKSRRAGRGQPEIVVKKPEMAAGIAASPEMIGMPTDDGENSR